MNHSLDFACSSAKKTIRGLGLEFTQDSTETDALLCLATKQTNNAIAAYFVIKQIIFKVKGCRHHFSFIYSATPRFLNMTRKIHV